MVEEEAGEEGAVALVDEFESVKSYLMAICPPSDPPDGGEEAR